NIGSRAVFWGSFLPTGLDGSGTLSYTPHDLQGALGKTAVWSEARDINDLGVIVGYWRGAAGAAGKTKARGFRVGVGVGTNLPTLPGDVQASASSINANGEIVGTSSPIPGETRGSVGKASRAVRWDPSNNVTDLGHAAEDNDGTNNWQWGYGGTGINDNGEVC